MAAPIAPKALAGGTTAAVSGAVLWALSTYVFRGNVPDGVASMIYVFMPGALAFAAAWLAPHQARPGDGTAAATSTAVVALTGEQMDAVRDALAVTSGRMEQTAADERKVPPG
jgi:hypothetical protein